MNLDEDAVVAAVELVGRTGATGFEIGYLHDDVPSDRAGWYAHAQYKGARISEEDHRGPTEAADALARRLLTGAKCTGCGGLVALSDAGAIAYPSATLTDGTKWDAKTAVAATQCRWTRAGRHWQKGCQLPRKVVHTGGRDLRSCVDKFGNISVDVTIGRGPGAGEERSTGASAPPVMVAAFLRDLADDVERTSLTAGEERDGEP